MKDSYLFMILLSCFLIENILFDIVFNVDSFIINSLSDQLSFQQIEEVLNAKEKWQWLSCVILPLVLLLKVSIIAVILHVGCFFFERDLSYKKLFNIVIKAEFIFLLVIACKTLWFYMFQTNYTLEDLQYFYPLSAINITGYENLKPWFVYPLQVLNLFEVAYWLVLAYLLGKEFKEDIYKGLTVVASSYGVGLVIWVVAVMFFTLNMS